MTDQDAIEIQNDAGLMLRQTDVQDQIHLLEIAKKNLELQGEAFVSAGNIGSSEFETLVDRHSYLENSQRFLAGVKRSIASEPRTANKAANIARAAIL